MNTFKIKAIYGRQPLKIIFEVEAKDFRTAQEEARKYLTASGFRYALIDTMTDLGPSKKTAPAQIPSDCLCGVCK
jgi:hypothetical protein